MVTATSAGDHPSRFDEVEMVQWEGWESRFDVSKSRILAGCTVFHGGRYYMWLSTGLIADRREGAMILGVSEDGVKFRPHERWQDMSPDPRWYQSEAN